MYGRADLVLIDLELPDLDGLEVCRAIRAVSDTPIIALTARGTEVDRVLGLQAGADDYMVEPCGFRELMARMQAVMRRARPVPRSIDAGSREVSLCGEPVRVTRSGHPRRGPAAARRRRARSGAGRGRDR